MMDVCLDKHRQSASALKLVISGDGGDDDDGVRGL